MNPDNLIELRGTLTDVEPLETISALDGTPIPRRRITFRYFSGDRYRNEIPLMLLGTQAAKKYLRAGDEVVIRMSLQGRTAQANGKKYVSISVYSIQILNQNIMQHTDPSPAQGTQSGTQQGTQQGAQQGQGQPAAESLTLNNHTNV
jgi:hypothetical protein